MRTSGKARNLAANPYVALMWRPQSEIYVSGEVELIDDVAAKVRLWESAWPPDDPVAFFGSPDNEDLILVRVHPARATRGVGGCRRPHRDTWHR